MMHDAMSDAELLVRAARNMGAMWAHVAVASGGRVETWHDAVAADGGAPNPVLNRTTITDARADISDLMGRTLRFYGQREAPWGIVDPWASLDLSIYGLIVLARMPCMVLQPAVAAPPPRAEDLRIERVHHETGLRDFKRALFGGFSMVPWPTDTGALFDRRTYEEPDRYMWVGYADDEPVACSVSVVRDGIVGVYLVAVLPSARRRGFGEAVSWAATLADATLPAVLQASVLGRPVYERMGYRAIGECVFWIPEA